MRRVKKLIALKKFRKAYIAAVRKPLKEKKVLFISDVRDSLDGNLKFVSDEIAGSDLETLVICRDVQRHGYSDEYITQTAEAIATSKYVLMEDVLGFLSEADARPGQKFVQLWHAAGAFKKFGFSRLANEGEKIRISTGYRKYTNATASAEFIRDKYAEAFDIDIDKVKACGVPRTDLFFDRKAMENSRNSLHEKYPVLKDSRMILFAPTYRGTRPAEATYDFGRLDFDILAEDLRKMAKEDGCRYVWVFKWHPAMASNGATNSIRRTVEKNSDVMADLTEVRDINNLLAASDMLITDYSSVLFDYSLLEKPVIYYPYDLEEYYSDRSFYFPYDEYIFGRVAADQKELVDAIRAGDMMENKRDSFRQKFMSACDGRSTEKVCAWIFEE